MAAFRFIVADDHPLFRRALYEAIAATFHDVEIEEAGDLDGILALLEKDSAFDLIVLDLKMPGAHGFSGLLFLRGQFPEIPVAIVSGVDDHKIIRQAMAYGASGFIPKSASPARMSEAFQCIMAGETWLPSDILPGESERAHEDDVSERIATLTPQQFKVLSFMIEGKLNKQISHDLGISLSTVKAHMTAILKKLGYQRRTQVIAAMRRLSVDDQSEISS